MLFGLTWSNVGYCHSTRGCKVAINNLFGANGITRGKDGTIYISSSKAGRIYVTEPQADNSLVITDEISLGECLGILNADARSSDVDDRSM